MPISAIFSLSLKSYVIKYSRFLLSFLSVEGNYLDEMLNWVEDFKKRLAAAESKQSKEELDLETKELLDAGWLIEQNKSERNS